MDGTTINSLCKTHRNVNNRVEYWRGLVYFAFEEGLVPMLFKPSPLERDFNNVSPEGTL